MPNSSTMHGVYVHTLKVCQQFFICVSKNAFCFKTQLPIILKHNIVPFLFIYCLNIWGVYCLKKANVAYFNMITLFLDKWQIKEKPSDSAMLWGIFFLFSSTCFLGGKCQYKYVQSCSDSSPLSYDAFLFSWWYCTSKIAMVHFTGFGLIHCLSWLEWNWCKSSALTFTATRSQSKQEILYQHVKQRLTATHPSTHYLHSLFVRVALKLVPILADFGQQTRDHGQVTNLSQG